jgi:hypothetical protein
MYALNDPIKSISNLSREESDIDLQMSISEQK